MCTTINKCGICTYNNVQGHKGLAGFKGPSGLRGKKVSMCALTLSTWDGLTTNVVCVSLSGRCRSSRQTGVQRRKWQSCKLISLVPRLPCSRAGRCTTSMFAFRSVRAREREWGYKLISVLFPAGFTQHFDCIVCDPRAGLGMRLSWCWFTNWCVSQLEYVNRSWRKPTILQVSGKHTHNQTPSLQGLNYEKLAW